MQGRGLNTLRVKGILTLTLITLTLFPSIVRIAPVNGAEVPTHVTAEYQYHFNIDADGDTEVVTIFTDQTLGQGSSWVVVPSYTEWGNQTTRGVIASFNLQPLISEGVVSPFWQNYSFTYIPLNGVFNLTLWFRVPRYAQVIEPKGFFLSPQVEYNPSSNARLVVVLPPGCHVWESDVKLLDYVSGGIRAPGELLISDLGDGSLRITGLASPSSRLAVAFTIPGKDAEWIIPPPSIGSFSAYTVRRYEDRAWSLLRLCNAAYPTFAETFNMDVGNMSLEFFVPSMDEFLQGLAGFVPFSEEDTRIFLNPFFYRMMEGYIEVVALHELVHHFVWKVGIQPSRLWVHEGMAEYLSIEVAKIVGYATGAKEHENTLLNIAEGLGGKLGFIQKWRLGVTPRDVKKYYAAAYKVFKVLADRYGGLNYYKRFFNLMRDFVDETDDAVVVTVLGRAANDVYHVFSQFEEWGFENIVDASELEGLLESTQALTSGLSPLLQPYKALAQWSLSRAVEAYSNGKYYTSLTYVTDAIFLAENAFTLTVATFIGAIFTAVVAYRLWTRRARRKPYIGLEERGFCPNCGSRLPLEAIYCPICGLKQR